MQTLKPFAQKFSSKRARRFALSTCVLLFAACSFGRASAQDTALADTESPNPHCSRPHARRDKLTIAEPNFGAMESHSRVVVAIKVARNTNIDSLHVKLNGHPIRERLHFHSCRNGACTLRGEVALQDGLREGHNLLYAQIGGLEGAVGASQRTTFTYRTGSGDQSAGIVYYEPSSIGVSTVGNGGNGNTWINLTTGNQAGVVDTAAQTLAANNSVSLAYPDASISIDCPNNLFQAVILSRTAPSAAPEATACINSEAEMEQSVNQTLGRALNNTDLVIFGTTPGNFAGNITLDTSSIGGTNYAGSSLASKLWYYDIIGVKGATPGTAHENYTTAPGPDTPFQYASFLGGTLMEDDDGNYNYIPSGDQALQVVSGQNPTLTVGSQSYSMPANNAPGAFWVIVLDRFLLQPINYNVGSWTTCAVGASNQSCGGVFDVHADGGAALGSTLSSVSPQNLIVLVSQGCPFDNSQQVSSQLAAAVDLLGGAPYSLQNLNSSTNTCAYSFVSNKLIAGNLLFVRSSLSGGVALSSNQFTAQSQTGSIHGYLARDNSGLYKVAAADQLSPETNNSASKPTVDYTFEETASAQRKDWPLTDTQGHLAAYHDISQQLLTSAPINESGSYIYDVRYFYTNTGVADDLITKNVQSLTQSQSDTASSTEFAAVQTQIASELQQLNRSSGYLLGVNGVEGLLDGSSADFLSNAFKVASAIGADQDHAAAQLVNANGANVLNLAAGITSLAGAVTTPLLPEIGVFMGVLSGALWTGSAGVSPLSGTLPGPQSQYDVLLSQIILDSSTYATNYQNGFGAAVDNIFTDPGKLATIGALTSDSNSNWNITNFSQDNGLKEAIVNGEASSLWLQVLPSLYGIRAKFGSASSNPATFGSLVYGDHGGKGVCVSVYSQPNSGLVPATSQVALTSFGGTTFDTYFLALNPNPSQPEYSVDVTDSPASTPLSTLLTTSTSVTIGGSTQTGLNLPSSILYTSSIFSQHAPLYFDANELCNASLTQQHGANLNELTN